MNCHHVVAVCLALIGLSGCSADFILEFDFPSADAFVACTTVEVQAVPAPSGENPCPSLIRNAQVGGLTAPLFSTGSVPICVLSNGSIDISNVPNGRLAYVAVARDRNGDAMLTACTITDVYETREGVVLTFTPTSTLRDIIDVGQIPASCTVLQYCGGTGC
jgi:hypothetical protein